MIDEAPKLVSSPSSSNHLEVIEELRCKDLHFLALSSLPPIFIDYQSTFVIADLWEKMGRKIKATKGGYMLVDQPTEETHSSTNENGS